ncbi:MAG: LamG domain-containing protein [Lentisphaerae bacterium]|nr:LamG domain-containing protein [Lentisphaerota bacterium]
MNTVKRVSVLLAILALSPVAWGQIATNEPPSTNEAPLSLAVDLVDGSRLVGVPDIASIPVQTVYAKMDLPLKQVQTMKWEPDREMAVFEIRNGDRIKGAMILKTLELRTVFGKVSVAIEDIKGLSVLLAGGALPHALEKGLVLHYAFDRDEGNIVTDLSGKANNGIVHGAKWIPLAKGGACSFEGRSYIETPHNPSLNITRRITISAWILLRTIPPYACWPAVVEKRSGQPGSGYALLQCSESSAVKLESAGIGSVNTKNPLPLNTWVHVAGTYDGDKMQLYVNGALDSTTANTSGSIIECATSVFIGRRSYEPVFFNGVLDEIMIFNRGLSAGEVKQIYDAHKRWEQAPEKEDR